MKSLLLWTCGFLLVSLAGANELRQFPENIVVAKQKDTKELTLTCHTQTDGPVTWKLHGMTLDDNIKQVGQNLVLSQEDFTPGEYSCWRGNRMLSSTYLLLDADEENKEDDMDFPFLCRAKSYDCTFSCQWLSNEYTAVRFGEGHGCSEGGKACHWVSGGKQLPDGGFQFELSHSLSPFAEESTMLEVTAEAINQQTFLRKTKRFYLRDIIQPDSPQIVKCQEVDQDLNVSIDPPSSWSTPYSFFRLEYEVEYVLRDDGQHIQTLSSSPVMVPKEISKLRVRSRDPLVPSTWSHWTAWKNVRTGKKLCKCRNTARYCCPELSSEYLDKCEKKKERKRNQAAGMGQ